MAQRAELLLGEAGAEGERRAARRDEGGAERPLRVAEEGLKKGAPNIALPISFRFILLVVEETQWNVIPIRYDEIRLRMRTRYV